MLSEAELVALVPVSRATIRRWVENGRFPKPAILGPRRIAWFLDDVVAWQNAVDYVETRFSWERPETTIKADIKNGS